MTTERVAAVSALTYLVRSLLAVPESRRTGLVGPGAKPWCAILERVTRNMGPDLRPVVVPLLSELARRAEGLTTDQRAAMGVAARRVLAFAWRQSPRDRGMIHVGIEGVVRTFDASPAESASLLRQLLLPAHLASFGYQDLPSLCRELTRLVDAAPAFVEDVYRAALGYREIDNSPTPMGDSAILPMRSNRRQDYGMALHQLGELFPRFMAVAPVEAAGAVIAAVDAEVAGRQTKSGRTSQVISFMFGGVQARYAEDLSYVWDRGMSHRHETHLRLLDGFEEGLVRLAGSTGDPAMLDRVLDRVARDNQFASIWNRVLRATVREPHPRLASRVASLACSPALIVASDTLEAMGRFIEAAFPILGTEQRAAIERSILAIPTDAPETQSYYSKRQSRLLGCLPPEHVVTEEARDRIQAVHVSGGPPPNTPLFEPPEVSRSAYTETHWLAEKGVALDAEPNRRLRELSEPVKQFASKFINEAPSLDEALEVMPALRALHEALAASGGDTDPLVIVVSWTHLAAACDAMASADWIPSEADVTSFVRATLLESSVSEEPTPDSNELFEQHGGVTPRPRWHAAAGLVKLARYDKLADQEVGEAIRRLGRDPVIEVRFEIARRLPLLYRTRPEVFWELLRRTESEEYSRRVIQWAVSGSAPIAHHSREGMLALARTVFARFRDETAVAGLRWACLEVVLTAHAQDPDPYTDELFNAVLADLARFTDEAINLVRVAASSLLHGLDEASDPKLDQARQASFRFLERVARQLVDGVKDIESRTRGLTPRDWPDALRNTLNVLHQVADELTTRTYFTSGSFDEASSATDGPRKVLDKGTKARFFREAVPLLELISEFPFPDVVHHLLEMLEPYTGIEPRTAFLLVGRAVRRGRDGGYQFESLAVGLVVKVVRRYLADHRSLFRDDRDCRDLLTEMLDTFVRAGWPEALELTFRLEEIFR